MSRRSQQWEAQEARQEKARETRTQAEKVADLQAKGYCGKCGRYIGRGRGLHQKRCKGHDLSDLPDVLRRELDL